MFARLSTFYDGRSRARLGLGDYLLIVRNPEAGGDASVAIYSTTGGLMAKNWMPAGSEYEETPDRITITHARGERLDIYIDRIHWEQAAIPTIEGKLEMEGRESAFSDLLARHLDELDPDLTLVAREAHSPAGPMDLLCVDSAGAPVIVEVKRVRVSASDLWQLRRYLASLKRMPEWADRADEARGVLVAPVLSKKAKPLVDEDPALSFVRMHFHQLAELAGEMPFTADA